MKLSHFASAFALFLGTAAYSESSFVIENFDTYKIGPIPEKGWTFRNGNPTGIYEILMEPTGNKFLHAKDTGKSVQVFKKQNWKIKSYPLISWRWRVIQFPEGSDERAKGKNDSAAGFYVVFPLRYFIPEAIKYVWSASAPVGTKTVRKERFPTLVIRTGKDKADEWITEVRNVVSDYKDHFHRPPPDPVAIGFLTDANEVKGVAEADYDEVVAKAQ